MYIELNWCILYALLQIDFGSLPDLGDFGILLGKFEINNTQSIQITVWGAIPL